MALSLTNKLIFGVFLFLGIGTLIFGFLNLYNNIYSPLNKTGSNNNEQSQIDAWEKIVNLQNTDTDEDGLSDYDEEYLYSTSPYLKDTDSDGFTDKQEVDSDNDPLCPAGVDCLAGDIQDQTTTTEDILLQDEEPSSGAELTTEMIQELQNLTPAQIRELLLTSNALTEQELNQIDDEQLMQVFSEMLKNNE